METLHALRVVDPAEFYRLPAVWQRRHLARTRNQILGRHAAQPTAKTPPRPDARHAAEAEAWRRMRAAPPAAAEVAAARRVLRLPRLPESLALAARQTLLRAGLEA